MAGDRGDALFSERRGGEPRRLSPTAFVKLVFGVLVRLESEGYFVEAFEEGEWREYGPNGEPIADPPRVPDPSSWLMLELGRADLWGDLREPTRIASDDGVFGLSPWDTDSDLVFDVLELYHRDVVSAPMRDEDGHFEGMYSRRAGRERFRDELRPILSRGMPPYEIRSSGQIVEGAPPGLSDLTDDPLGGTSAEDELRTTVDAAVRRFRGRDAKREDQLAALTELAGVLERLRADSRLAGAMSRADQAPLFHIANEWGIRHNTPEQQRNYGAAGREWIFHAYLAAIRFALRVADDTAEAPSE